MMLRSFAWALLPLLAGGHAPLSRPQPAGQVSAMSLSSTNGTARLAIAVDRGVNVHETKMQNPDRVVLDFEPALKGDFAAYDGQHRGNVADIRVNQFKPNVVRVVVEFDHLPDYKVTQSADGTVSLSYADKAFNTWGADLRTAADAVPATPVPVAHQVIRSEPEPVVSGFDRMQLQDTTRFSVNWDKTPIEDALNQLAIKANRSIVPGKDVTGNVSMTIRDQPWQNIFQALLAREGLSATVMAGDIIRVDSPGELSKLDSIERLTQAQVRLNYAKAGEMANNITGMLTKGRGSVRADTSTNTLIIVDTRTRIDEIRQFVESLDLKTPTIAIQAKLVFVDRTDLQQLGVKYDVGTANQFFNQIVQRTDPTTGQPYDPTVNVVNLGGNTVSAISNADALISNSALDLVFSTAIGGFSISSFLSALEQVELTDVEAEPIIHTLDNREAEITSGEQTPVRIIDASSLNNGSAPRATVAFKETGIKLKATPHVTANRQILMDLDVERSSVQQLAAADLGYNIPIQHGVTRLLVNDGETAVIAGLTVTTVTKNRQGIPLLSGLPFIGNLFAFSTNSEHRQDLIILVTPRILDDPSSN
ncbi:MAG TPA: secretin N-terminal domain-containing protein [Gemmatimonadales bacterium]|jgi:type IV pilus assembly protein PilQ